MMVLVGSVNGKGVIVTLHNEQSTPLSPVHLGGYDTIMELILLYRFYISPGLCSVSYCSTY